MKVLRFTASWCGPCKALAKTLEEVETNIPIDVIDVDERTDLALEYGIRSVPTMIMLDSNNQVVKKMTGTKPQTELREWLNG